MYFLGHIAIGYFSARIIEKKINIPLVWLFSVLPDIDILIPFLQHRGPTHSLIFILLVFFLTMSISKKGLPYVVALSSHSLIGDLVTGWGKVGGIKLFWPFYSGWINLGSYFIIESPLEIGVELVLFTLMTISILRRVRNQGHI